MVLGASPKPQRFANQAVRLLMHDGHRVIPVHPKATVIEGISVVPSLAQVQGPVDTLNLYLGPSRAEVLIEQICRLQPARVIFNPGTESASMAQRLREAGTEVVMDCTLVMLRSGRF